MAKKEGNVSRLPGAGDGPLEPEDLDVAFDRRLKAARDAGCDQFILIVCRNGNIEDIIARRDNRHEVRGILEEAFPMYNAMTGRIFVIED